MSSVNAGSSCPGRGKSYKSQVAERQSRRSWSLQEELFLVACLKELVAQSWRGDNGFHMGYQQCLEEMIRKEFPGTDIRMSPHINSKLQTWKKQHLTLNMILGTSVVGFNRDGKYMIDCEDHQWEDIVKKDPSAKAMRYKSWPLLDHWNEILGRTEPQGIMPKMWLIWQTMKWQALKAKRRVMSRAPRFPMTSPLMTTGRTAASTIRPKMLIT